jgi:hypothetical protein
VIFLAEFCGLFLGDFVGCHVRGPCASLAGDFAPKSPLNRTRFGGFSSCSSSALERRNLKLLLIVSVSGQFL